MKTITFIILVFVTFLSCQDLVSEKYIVGRYYVVATDADEEQQLSCALGNGSYIGLVPGYTLAVAYNSKYIAVKQRLNHDDKNILNYYILERQNVEANRLKTVDRGPITEDTFNNEKLKLEVYGTLLFNNL